LSRLKSDVVKTDVEAPVRDSEHAGQMLRQRMSALELGKRSVHGPVVYIVCALIAILGSSIRSDYPLMAVLVLLSLCVLAVARIYYLAAYSMLNFQLVGGGYNSSLWAGG